MKLKKLTASILAAALALTAIPLTVSAAGEETEKLPLVTADLREIHGATGIASVGRGVYFYFVDGGIKGAVHISDQQLKSWKETGELSYTDINTDGLFTDSTVKYSWYVNITFSDGDYMTLLSKDEDGNELSKFAVRYDEEANSIVKVKDFEPEKNVNYSYYNRTESITHKGYTLSKSEDIENSTFTIKAFAPDGTEAFSNTYDGIFFKYTYGSSDIVDILSGYDVWINRHSDKYCCYVFMITEEVKSEYRTNCKYTIFAIDYNGETTDLYSGVVYKDQWRYFGAHPYFYESDLLQVSFWGARNGVDGYLYFDNKKGVGYSYSSYDKDSIYYDDKIVYPDFEKVPYDIQYCYYYGAADMNKNIIVGMYRAGETDAEGNRNYYDFDALIDVEKNEIISDLYTDIQQSGDNGETYLAKNLDGKYVFIDKNGKELGTFDKASRFCNGDYAPVIVDGKAYIINRDMEIVSEGIEADEVWFLNKNVECIKQG